MKLHYKRRGAKNGPQVHWPKAQTLNLRAEGYIVRNPKARIPFNLGRFLIQYCPGREKIFHLPKSSLFSVLNTNNVTPSNNSKLPTNTGALATLVMVFFFWGFIAASQSIFIPFCKHNFALTQFESQLIGSAFYGAYFIGSLALYLISSLLKYDILKRIGFKKGII